MTETRPTDLQTFLDAALAAYGAANTDDRAQASIARTRAAARTPGTLRASPGQTRAVCAHLAPALDHARGLSRFPAMLDALAPLLDRLVWGQRSTWDSATASPNFPEGHANAMIFGPGGIEERADFWLGLSLLAPGVRYPDHTHPPEETYLVLSQGDFRQADGNWFTPGVDGSFYNTPGIVHAMRSGPAPLLALWLLWSDKG